MSLKYYVTVFPIVCGMLVASVSAADSLNRTALPIVTTVKYDASTDAQYADMWTNLYGPGELAVGGTRTVTNAGTTIDATPFRTGVDLSVFDHLKYFAASTRSFTMPVTGSLEFSVDITAYTPGTEYNRKVQGCYGAPFSYPSLNAPCAQPFEQVVLQGQQASAALNMINFETGQLFDWLVSGDKAFALIERLPSNITGSPGTPVTSAYTQIIAEIDILPGVKHNYAIRYHRDDYESYVEYFINQQLFARVDNVGIPLDRQYVPYSGYAPSLGEGEILKDRLNSFVLAHGLFSLLDAFPYHHPDAPELSVSIPMSQRLFGQGAQAKWNNFKVVTKSH